MVANHFRLPEKKDDSSQKSPASNWKIDVILVLLIIQIVIMGGWWWTGLHPAKVKQPNQTAVKENAPSEPPVKQEPSVSSGQEASVPEATVAEKPATRSYEQNPIRVQILNGCGVRGIARKMTDCLRAKGFDVRETGNAARYDYAMTEVIVRTNDQSVGDSVAKKLGVDSVSIVPDRSLVDIEVTVIIGKDYKNLRCP
jgi:cytoskeletal protein RodZ